MTRDKSMYRTIQTLLRRRAALLLGVALAGAPLGAAAQEGPLALRTATLSEGGEPERASALSRGRYAVVIDLDENRLFFKRGDLTLWSAPVGTGTGLRLKADDEEWKFSTPNGVFHVQYKEQNPVWIAPDWYYVENGLPIPKEMEKRRFPGGLGAAAVFFESDLAIHGTNKPELLGQRVSHGCIRLSNKDALRLYHNVQIGTEIVIVGGRGVKERVVTPAILKAERAKATFDPARPAPKDPVLEGWKAMSTADLTEVLANELSLKEESTRWAEVAGLLLDRGLKDSEDAALHGLMNHMDAIGDPAIEREYATFLAHAYGRAPLRTLTALSRLDHELRPEVARAIVDATMNLYHGAFDDAGAPWPTARVPKSVVDPQGWRGWDVLADAERSFRAPPRRQEPEISG